MKFLFASDSFKGTLSSPKTAELLTCAAREIFPDCICDSIEVADGGEGTTDAVLSAVNGKSNSLKVHGPLWEELTCSYGMLDEKIDRVIAFTHHEIPDFHWCRMKKEIHDIQLPMEPAK